MLLDIEKSVMILVDVQEKLTPLIHDYQTVVEHQKWLMELANELEVPLIVSEQYPHGLGKTIHELSNIAKKNNYHFEFDKCDFSCSGSDVLLTKLEELQRPQIILIGIETHVCILQTAIELRAKGYSIFVVSEASSSRAIYDKEIAFLRLMSHGVQVVTKEMVFFEWLRTSKHPKFRELSKRFLQ